ncbi:MAG: hypothetical protein WAO95_18075, partial [Burkholderiales bacterium]
TCWSFASGARGGAGQAAHSAQGGGAGGGPAQPAARTRMARENGASAMWVIYLEMGVALAILVLIVWFTWPRKRPPDKDAD